MSQYSIQKVGSWVDQQSINLDEKRTENVPYVYLLVDYQELVKDDQISSYKRTIEQINDESRIEDSSLYIIDLKDEYHHIIIHSLEITRDRKKINALNEDNISTNQRELSLERHVVDQTYTVSISIDDLRVGDIIEYQTTMVVNANIHPLDGQFFHSYFWLQWRCPVEKQVITINNQSNKAISIQECTMKNGCFEEQKSQVATGETYTRTLNDLSLDMIDNNTAPSWLWSDFIFVSTVNEWQYISAYLYDYYQSQNLINQVIDLSEIPEIYQDKTLEEQVITIVRFVQNDVRYKGENHGIYSHTPKSPLRTLQNRHGDCKDKSVLLLNLLHTIGVEADLVLCNTYHGMKLNALSPSPFHFNHMIICLHFAGKTYYFDPTIKKQGGDLEHSVSLKYGHVLSLTKAGNSLFLLQSKISDAVFKLKHTFDLSDKSAKQNTLTIQRKYYKHRADNMRYYLNSKQSNLIAEEYLTYAKEDGDLNLTIESPMTISVDDIQNNILETTEVYKINDSKGDDEFFELQTSFTHEFPVSTTTGQPYRIDLEGVLIHDIDVIYQGKTPKANEGKAVNNKWFKYKDSVKLEKNTYKFNSTVEPLSTIVKADEISDYIDEVDKMYQRRNNKFPKKLDTSFLNSTWGAVLSWVVIAAIIYSVIHNKT